VYDNDSPAKDLIDKQEPRWKAEDSWKVDGTSFWRREARDLGWLTYRHLLRGKDGPQLVTDFMGYNTYLPHGAPANRMLPGSNWVGDLILECEVRFTRFAEGELVLELGKGVDRFQARFDLGTGTCVLLRNGEKLASAETPLSGLKEGHATFSLRFANVDQKLTLWVGDTLPFGRDGVIYSAAKEKGPRRADLEPARIGVKGDGLTVRKLKLWRDTYYTTGESPIDVAVPDLGDPTTWDDLKTPPVRTWYIPPGHYFFLGDNSAESSDSRNWGLVPRPLLLGRAYFVYYPFDRLGRLE
jgi:signal peptidase I